MLQTINKHHPLPMRRMEARDRRLSAVHEAGHIVIAQYFGDRDAWGRIHQLDGRDEQFHRANKSWIGQSTYNPRFVNTEYRRQMLGIAGVAAEWAWESPEAGDHDYDGCLEDAGMSPSDWEAFSMIPDDDEEQKRWHRAYVMFTRCFRLFRLDGRLRPKLIATTRALIQEEARLRKLGIRRPEPIPTPIGHAARDR
jgi:hypothetical protein